MIKTNIELDDEQKKTHPFLQSLLKFIDHLNTQKLDTDIEYGVLDGYLEEFGNSFIANYIRELLLGEVNILAPSDYDDWTNEEKDMLIKRWEIIESLRMLTKAEYEEDDEDYIEDSEERKLLN